MKCFANMPCEDGDDLEHVGGDLRGKGKGRDHRVRGACVDGLTVTVFNSIDDYAAHVARSLRPMDAERVGHTLRTASALLTPPHKLALPCWHLYADYAQQIAANFTLRFAAATGRLQVDAAGRTSQDGKLSKKQTLWLLLLVPACFALTLFTLIKLY